MEVSAVTEQAVKRKRNIGKSKANVNKSKKKMKMMSMEGNREKKKDFQMNKKMEKIFKKRARDYNSDNDDDDDVEDEGKKGNKKVEVFPRKDDDEEEEEIDMSDDDDEEDEEEKDEDEDEDDVEPGIMKFTEGSRAFRLAFKSIMKKSVADDVLGPVLSAHKKLIAEKLAEEESERKVKGDAKKEKQMIKEKGHVKLLDYLDAREKFLIGVATKGVVKLFNAVNKAQNAQKGLNPDRSKDSKVLRKRRNQAFFSELGKAPRQGANSTAKDSGEGGSEGPTWAPLRDNYMLSSSKLKNWDKMPDATVRDDIGRISEDDSSGDED
ncbi:hypothetical protein ACFE04_000810 [Oxalis oulophora]